MVMPEERVRRDSRVSYFGRWNAQYREAVDALTEDEARRRHERGELYAVVLGDPAQPWAYVDVRLEVGYVSVHVLDGDLRPAATYRFSREEGERDDDLFLGYVESARYVGDSDEVDAAVNLYFAPSGDGLLQSYEPGEEEPDSVEFRHGTETLRLAVPAFGEWEWVQWVEARVPEPSYLRRERIPGIPPATRKRRLFGGGRREPIPYRGFGRDISATYAERRDGEVLSEREARRRHERGEGYVVLLGTPERPWACAEARLGRGLIRVHTLDDAGRPESTYEFTSGDGEPADTLFLRSFDDRELGEGGDVESLDHFVYGPDGRGEVTEWVRDDVTPQVSSVRHTTETLWLEVPEFGDWAWIDGIENRLPERLEAE